LAQLIFLFTPLYRLNQANIIEICVNNEDREKAKVLAEQIREQGTSFIKNILPLDKLNVEQETVVSEDGLKSDSGINIKLNTVMGGVLGFIGIIFLILMKYTFSDKISTEEDVKKRLGLKVLVSIPNYAPDSKIKRYLSIR
jgi:capsular polysaccharide biosynthesis protein